MRSPRLLGAVIFAVLLLAGGVARATSYKIVVHPDVPAASLDRRFLSEAFLKKATRWSNGEVIRPVDLAASSAVRRAFSEDVLGRTVEAVKSYWQQLIFSGRDVPPPELDSDEDVVRYVLKHPGAIGYVSNAADLGGAKLVSVK